MRVYLAVAIGGIIGCWARYAMTVWLQSAYGRDFPYATLAINLIGSFLMGLLFVLTLERATIEPYIRVGILTGVLGGFTTFSTYAMETLLLAEGGEAGKGMLYVVLSNVLGIGAALVGAALARSVF
jgi:fluoride exporter